MIVTRIAISLFISGCLLGPNVVFESGASYSSTDPSLHREGKYVYHANSRINGFVTEYHSNGSIKSTSHYQCGLLQGTVITFYPDGKKESVRYFQKDEKDGVHRGWWPNGKLRFEYHFNNGVYHGSFKEWYADGKPLHHFQYENGKEVRAVGWRENGKPYINFVVRNGRKYGLTNARLCYSLKDEQGIYITSTQQ